MNKNHEIENQNSRAEKAAVNESSQQMSFDALNPKNDNRRAFASMDSSKSNNEADKMLESTKFAIVDHSALVKSVDNNGYISGSVENSVRAQVGHAAAEAAIANAKMSHASAAVSSETSEAQRNGSVDARTESVHAPKK